MEDNQNTIETEKQKGYIKKGGNGGYRAGSGRKSGIKDIELIRKKNRELLSECEVRERFRILNEIYDRYEVIFSQEAFPDLFIKRNGKNLLVEVEKSSSDFKRHKHNPDGCDLIICWEHDWKDCYLPIIELKVLWENYKKNKI